MKKLKKYVIADFHRFGVNKHGWYTGTVNKTDQFSENDHDAIIYPSVECVKNVLAGMVSRPGYSYVAVVIHW